MVWELLYADDLVLLAESRAELERRLMEWIGRLKEEGLRVNIEKTKVMNCKVGIGLKRIGEFGQIFMWNLQKRGGCELDILWVLQEMDS